MNNYYFDYIMYMAFESLLMYDERRFLTVKQLHDYNLFVTDRMKAWIKNDNNEQKYNVNRPKEITINYDIAKKDFLDKQVNLSIEDEMDLLELFLKNNNKWFERRDDKIYIKQDIIADDLSHKTLYEYRQRYKEYSVIFMLLGNYKRNSEAIKILNAESYKNELIDIVNREQIMEKLFLNYDKSIKKLIRDINILNYYKMSKYYNKTSYECSALNGILEKFNENIEPNEGICLNLFSKELETTDLFYKNNPSLFESHFNDTDIKLGLWFETLFNNCNFYLSKIQHQLQEIVMYKQIVEIDKNGIPYEDDLDDEDEIGEFDDLEYVDYYDGDDYTSYGYTTYRDEFDNDNVYEYSDFDEKEDFMSLEKQEKSAFIKNNAALKYIQQINDYEKRFGYNEELTKTKRRILYILNTCGYELYEDEKLPKIVENISFDEDDNKRDYMDFYIHARLFLFDIIVYKSFDELTLNKILFVSTYYDLTHDIRIKRIIDKYKDTTDIGNRVYRAIINHESNLFLYQNDASKKLIKD